MVDLLFIWCKLTPEIGYRQGMHELIAPLLWAVDFDSLSPPRFSDDDEDDEDDRSLAHLVLSRNHVEHDTWQLFSTLMKSAKAFYDFTPSVPQAVDSSKTAASAPSPSIPSSSSKTSAATAFGIPPASSSASVLVQPIVATAIRIHDGLLKTIDCALWAKLESLAIEPQLYALRWLRLLFSREFPMQDTMCLWDGLFAEDASSLRLMQHLCVAMLLRIRDALLEADYSETLQLLLRYPALPDGTHRVTQLLQQAVYLRDNVSAEAGERCRMQNRERGEVAGAHILGSGGMDTARRRPSSASSSHGHRNMSSMAPAMATSPGLLGDGGFVGDLAKGAYARAEALGINKALLGTFNEIKVRESALRRPANTHGDSLATQRSYAQAQAQAQAAQAARDRMSQIPNHQQHQHRTEARRPLPVASPPPAPALKDHLADMGQARSTNLAMSQALDLCINTLQHEVGGGGSEGPLAALTLSTQAMMALTALGHVRDVLAGKTRTFDASVLAPLRETLEAGQLAATASNEERDTASSDAASLIDVEPPSSIPITPFSQPQPLHRPSNGDARFHPSTVSSSASSSPSTSATPPLMLSTRSDKPLPSLTRVPQPSAPKSNAPAHSHSVPRTQTGADATNRLRDVPVMSFTSNRAGASASRPQPSSSNSTADPLGALL